MRRRGTACGYSAQCHVISHRTANIRRPPSGRRTPRGCPVSCSDRATVALSALSPSFCLFTVAHDSGRILCLGRIILRAGPFVKRFALCYGTVVWLSCLSVLSVTLVYCGQTVGRIKLKLGKQVGLGPGHVVLDGTQLSSSKGA